jgi:hypothetical protein
VTAATLLFKLIDHLYNHSRRYLFSLLIAFLIFGLWPFNFTENNKAVISPTEGLEITKPGSVYTAGSIDKLHDLKQFTIYIDVVTSSNGLSGFEKILSYALNQQNANFIVGQWKDGLGMHLRADGRTDEIHFGDFGILRKNERVYCAIVFNGNALSLFVNGSNKEKERLGQFTFKSWDQTYTLVVGTDAIASSQWKGTIYEAAIYDRALSPEEVKSLSGRNKAGTRDEGVGKSAAERQRIGKEEPQATPSAGSGWQSRKPQANAAVRQKKPQAASHKPQGDSNEDRRPLIHYVFNQENTYETEFRGKKAIGVGDLGKGEPADLVIPEHFEPYERVFLGWEEGWMQYRANWLDVAVNIVGFIPFGLLMFWALVKRNAGLSGLSRLSSLSGRNKAGTRDEGVGTSAAEQQDPESHKPQATSRKAGEEVTKWQSGRKEEPQAVRLALLVLLAVIAGFVVSFAIEYLQAYLPSRDSSLRDLITNILGTMIGAVAAAWMLAKSNWELGNGN